MPGRLWVCAAFLSALTLQAQTPLLPRIDSIRLAGFNGAARFSPGAYAFVAGINLGTQPAVTVNGAVAPVLFADTFNVAFQVPVTVSLGPASVVLRTLVGSSPAFPIVVGEFSPSVFSLTFGVPPLAFFETSPGVLEFNPQPLDRLRLYVNGLGTRTPPATPQLLIDGLPVPVLSVTTAPIRLLSPNSMLATVAVISFEAPSIRPGTHELTVVAGGVFSPPVPLNMLAAGLIVSQVGLTFNALQGGPSPAPQTFSILSGQGTIDFIVSTTTFSGGSSWLAVTPSSGSSQVGRPGSPIQVRVNPSGLEAGAYYGILRLSSRTESSIKSLSVVLKVFPPNTSIGPFLDSTGLVFVGSPGGADPPAQSIAISNPTAGPLSFTSSIVVTSGTNQFRFTPASSTINSGQSLTLNVEATLAGLPAGIHNARLNLSFSDGTVRSIILLLVVAPEGGSVSRSGRSAGACTATRLLPVFVQPTANFGAPASWPAPIETLIVDDCGASFTAGSVNVTFSNGDPVLSLTSLRNGRWTGTWPPRNARASGITLTVRALDHQNSLQGTFQISGGVPENPDVPFIKSGGVVDLASYGAQVAPGSLISISGGKLSSGEAASSTLPLETTLLTTSALLSGLSLPLVSTSDGQVVAVAPYEIAVNTRHQLIVQNGGSLSIPENVLIVPTRPAVFTTDSSGRGQGSIYKVDSDGNQILADANSPAKPGDSLVVSCTGLGAVDPPVAVGSAAPKDSLTNALNPVEVTMGGLPATVTFAGLAPGAAGLYQVIVTVPAGLPDSDTTQMILSAGGQESVPVTFAVRNPLAE